jgi:hypothetical protein
MTQVIKKLTIKALMAGKPKKSRRATIQRILALAEEIRKNGIAFFPYYTKNLPEEYEAYRASDTRELLEREIGAFFYTTGNWEHLFDGKDVMACWQDESINAELADAGFIVRETNTERKTAEREAKYDEAQEAKVE